MPIDYDALAKQAGAISSAPAPSGGVDYNALAKQAGAVSSTPAATPAAAPAQPSAVSRYFSNLWDQVSPSKLVAGIDQAVYHPIDTARAAIQAQANVGAEAADSFKKGNYAEGVKHGLLYMLPIVGAQLDAMSNQAESGDIAGSLGAATGAGLLMAAPESPAVKAGVGAATDAVKAVPGKIATRAMSGAIQPALDPAEASAVAYGRANGVKMSAATQTGSKVAANAENILQNLPGAAGIAKTARAQEQSTLAAAGAKEVGEIRPGAPVAEPLDAGQAIHSQLDTNIAQHGAEANDAYDLLRSIEAQPQFKATVQTGTKRVLDPNQVDEAGNPVYKSVPVTQDIQLPVDLRPVKAALQPIYDRMMRQMPIAQQQASAGLKAIDNIVNGPDFESASITDENLGAIKSVARDTTSPIGQGLAKVAVQQLDNAVQNAVKRAGPDALDALQRGRAATVNKYAAQAVKDSLPTEPVELANTLTRNGDRSINLLRSVAGQAPEQMPALGQAVVQGLLDKVTAEAGMGKPTTALSAWNNLGDQTKQVLFQDPKKIQQLTDFFTLAKKMSENPNPSGSGQVLALGKMGLLLATAPYKGVPLLLGSRAVANMLFNPETSRLMQVALRTPTNSAGAGLLSRDLTAAMAKQGVTPDAAPRAASTAAAAPAVSNDTSVSVPGEPDNTYQAKYAVKELGDVNASHNGLNFQPNPKYGLTNDRNYSNAVNQGKVIGWASRSEFDPAYHITDNPDATNGPMVVDSKGNVLGGNGRAMILQRVYSGNPEGAAAYRSMLEQKAGQFGINPDSFRDMKRPVLVREIPDSEFSAERTPQDAITDFNKKGTAELTPAERAISDSRRVSPETLEDVAGRLESHGADATLADVLQGKSGGEVLGRLVKDGVISPQEQAAFVGDNGELTPAGKSRISQLMLGRFFSDPKQLDNIAPSIRGKIERLAAPLAQVEGRGEWNLTPDVQAALEILQRAQSHGVKNVADFIKQDGLFGAQNYSERAQALATALQKLNPNELTAAARQYAGDSNFAGGGENLFGANPTPAGSFSDAFGEDAVARAIAARQAKKNANALAPAKSAPKNSLSK